MNGPIVDCAAFNTSSGMPYGTVNLRRGVPKGETTITCTAGIGTYLVEFATLSRLTGDAEFERVARRAMTSLWKCRSEINLVGGFNLSCLQLLFYVSRILFINE